MNDMEKRILELFEEKYHKRYVGGLKVVGLTTGGYKLTLNLGADMTRPVEIAADLKAEDFLKFIEQEIVSRQLHKAEYFTGVKIELDEEQRRTCCKNG